MGYIDIHCCIAAFASDYGGKTNIIIIMSQQVRCTDSRLRVPGHFPCGQDKGKGDDVHLQGCLEEKLPRRGESRSPSRMSRGKTSKARGMKYNFKEV